MLPLYAIIAPNSTVELFSVVIDKFIFPAFHWGILLPPEITILTLSISFASLFSLSWTPQNTLMIHILLFKMQQQIGFWGVGKLPQHTVYWGQEIVGMAMGGAANKGWLQYCLTHIPVARMIFLLCECAVERLTIQWIYSCPLPLSNEIYVGPNVKN